MNYIVVRHSPDWLNFDPEESRAFLLSCGLPETLIIDYVAIWDAHLAIPFREFRHRLKIISLENFANVTSATMVHQSDFDLHAIPDDAYVAFSDDDDLYHPAVFDCCATYGPAHDGYLWSSIFLAASLNREIPLVHRENQAFVFTNNYAVSARKLKEDGLPQYLEHLGANYALETGGFKPTSVSEHLSLANKMPASTVMAHSLMQSSDFRQNPGAVFETILGRVQAAEIDRHSSQWLAEPLNAYKELARSLLR